MSWTHFLESPRKSGILIRIWILRRTFSTSRMFSHSRDCKATCHWQQSSLFTDAQTLFDSAVDSLSSVLRKVSVNFRHCLNECFLSLKLHSAWIMEKMSQTMSNSKFDNVSGTRALVCNETWNISENFIVSMRSEKSLRWSALHYTRDCSLSSFPLCVFSQTRLL